MWAIPAVLLCVLLQSCAPYHAEPINLHVSARRFAARTLDNPRLDAYLTALGLRPRGTWGFRRLSYVAVYERPQLRIADAKYRASLGNLRTAEEISNPTIGISAAYNATVLVPSPWTVGPILGFLIQNFFSKDALIGAARQNVLAAREAIGSVAWDERKRVYGALLALWADLQTTMLDRQEAALDGTIARAVEKRYRVGAASATALTTAKLNAATAAFQQHQAELATRLARVHLADVVGLPPTALRGVAISFAIFRQMRVPNDLSAEERAALVNRPAVRKALAKYNAAQFALKAAVNDLVSGLSVAPGYTINQGTYNYSLGVQANPPVFNRHSGRIEVARAQRQLAAGQLRSVQEGVFNQIAHAATYWRASRSAVVSARRALRSAERELAASRQAYRAGTIGGVRLLGVRLQVLSSRTQLLSAEQKNYAAIGDLMAALHGKFWRIRNANTQQARARHDSRRHSPGRAGTRGNGVGVRA